MAALTEPLPTIRVAGGGAYDAFISYSHAKDKPIAAALQTAIQRLGKAWYQRRALRVFRDDTSLSATPHLWPTIEQALGRSRFLLLLASPEAAASRWVERELDWWLAHNGPEQVLIALTAGELAWDEAAGDFVGGETLPPALRVAFANEPRWIDLRAYRDTISPRDPRFAELAAEFAAAIRGIPKEDLLSQELRQQRRALRLAWSGMATLVVLLGLAGWQWTRAEAQRARAERSLALATQTANGLIFNLADRFRDFGLPASTVGDILESAHQLQRQLIAGGENAPALLYSEAIALLASGETLRKLGDSKRALADAQRARDILEPLANAYPAIPDYRRHLAISEDQIGDVLRDQDKTEAALARYREALEIRKTLASRNAENLLWRHDVATSEDKIADVLEGENRLDDALTLYRDVKSIAEGLVAMDAKKTEWRRDLSVAHDQIGNVLEKQGRLEDALAAHRDSRAVMSELLGKEPNNTEWQSNLAATDERIGHLLRRLDRLDEALGAYRDYVAMTQKLANAEPDNMDRQYDLALSRNTVGDVLGLQRRADDALAVYHDALGTLRMLTAKDASIVDWRKTSAIIDDKIGGILLDKEDFTGALAAYRDALKIRKALADSRLGDVARQRQLADSHQHVAVVLLASSDLAGAVSAAGDALALRRVLAAKHRDDEQLRTDLAGALNVMAWLRLLDGQPQQALDLVQRALAIVPDSAWVKMNQAHALLLLGRVDEARAIYIASRDLDSGTGTTMGALAKGDFASLREFGIDTPDMKQIEGLFAMSSSAIGNGRKP